MLGCSCVLQLGLLAKLLKSALLLIVEAWVVVVVSSCGSALRADFFKRRSRLLKVGLPLCAAAGLVCEAPEVCAAPYCLLKLGQVVVSFCGSALRADFFFFLTTLAAARAWAALVCCSWACLRGC